MRTSVDNVFVGYIPPGKEFEKIKNYLSLEKKGDSGTLNLLRGEHHRRKTGPDLIHPMIKD